MYDFADWRHHKTNHSIYSVYGSGAGATIPLFEMSDLSKKGNSPHSDHYGILQGDLLPMTSSTKKICLVSHFLWVETTMLIQ